MEYLLDTGILLRLIDTGDPLHSVTRAAVQQLHARGDRPFMSLQNVAEFWNVSTRPVDRNGYGLPVAEVERRLAILETVINVLHDSPQTYGHWRQLVVAHSVRGVQVHDTKLAALMFAHGLTHLLTFNVKDFRRFPWIAALTPEALTGASSPQPPSSAP